ncbi:MAG: hypothetical protein ACU836_17890 [Gammaproteobacteria bacterium]
MAKKKKPTEDPEPELTPEQVASLALRPSVNAAAIVKEYAKPLGDQNLSALVEAIVQDIEKINTGDMKRCEGMLLGQAEALQSMFMNLSRRALTQEYLKNFEAFMRLALKAQNQCRMTLETLSNIKNPPVVYAKQANIANGPQQVNNGVPATRAAENQNQQNKLLEATDGERLDTRTTKETIGSDTAMATVG